MTKRKTCIDNMRLTKRRHCKFSESLLPEMGFHTAHLHTTSHGQAKHMKIPPTVSDAGAVPEPETSAHWDHRDACERSFVRKLASAGFYGKSSLLLVSPDSWHMRICTFIQYLITRGGRSKYAHDRDCRACPPKLRTDAQPSVSCKSANGACNLQGICQPGWQARSGLAFAQNKYTRGQCQGKHADCKLVHAESVA